MGINDVIVVWLDNYRLIERENGLEKEYQDVQIGKCDPWPLRVMLETWSPTQWFASQNIGVISCLKCWS